MAQYFRKFPKIFYNNILFTDIISRIAVAEGYRENDDIYYYYDYQDGDTPEIIASKYYNNPELHWVVMITNDIYDGNFDVPMPYQTFSKYIEDKYSEIAKTSPKDIQIVVSGKDDGYSDGVYINIPLYIYEIFPLSTYGQDLTADITVYNGEIIDVSVNNAGKNYSIDTFFTINPFDLNSSISQPTCIFRVGSFMSGTEYASKAVDPEFGYQKVIKTSELYARPNKNYIDLNGNLIPYKDSEYDFEKDKKTISEEYYVIGKQSYFDIIPALSGEWTSSKTYLINDVVSYEIDGLIYLFICNVCHVSGSNFNIDLEDKKWRIFNSNIVSTIFYERIYSQIPQVRSALVNNGSQTIIYEILRKYPLVTVMDREIELNEKKRKIKILKKELVPHVESQFNFLMGKANA